MSSESSPATTSERRYRALASRLLAPNLSYCRRCRTSYWGRIRNERHETPYTETSAVFALCEECWAQLAPHERMPYYDALVDNWIAQSPERADKYAEDRALIRKAVMAGG